MTQKTSRTPLSTFPWRFAVSAILAAALLVAGPAAYTDDTRLLRFDSAKPYVFILLDTSASMGLQFEQEDGLLWTPGGGDSPGSRLYQAKQSLYNVFSQVNDDVHFGFASFNQDRVRATAKHWIYYTEDPLPPSSDWPIGFPKPDIVDGANLLAKYPDATGDGSMLTELVSIPRVDENGNVVVDPDNPPPRDTRVLEVDGDVMTFGKAFVDGRVAGTCAAPLNLSETTDRAKAQSFAIDGLVTTSGGATGLWVRPGLRNNEPSFYLTVERPGKVVEDGTEVDNRAIGKDSMQVKLNLWRFSSCPSGPPPSDSDPDFAPLIRKMRLDPHLNQTFFVDGAIGDGTSQGTEQTAGLWQHQDAKSFGDFGGRPFTGKGWEGNYDSGGVTGITALDDSLAANDLDFYCATTDLSGNVITDPALCPAAYLSEIKPTVPTVFVDTRRSLDYGDMIPFDWDFSRQSLFLARLAPNRDISTTPDFRGASYFQDEVTTGGLLHPRDSTRKPLLALDQSPLAKAINDLRCWYLGTRGKGGNKCKAENPLVETGWEELACGSDSSFGCRKPYMIIISDGEDSGGSGTENPTADVGDLFGASGMLTWVLNLGPEDNCKNGLLNSIVNAAGTGKGRTGQCINVGTGSALRQELEAILGRIKTETRAFASAAVPTVQATVEQKIFLTNFTPFNDNGVWDGHILAFLKPLPVDEITGKPDTDKLCSDDGTGENRVQNCHLWDAESVVLTHQYKEDTETGFPLLDETESDGNLRRVYYAKRAPAPGQWASGRRLLDEVELSDPVLDRFDLWRGLGLEFKTSEPVQAEGDPHVNQAAADTSNAIIRHLLRKKTGTVELDGTATETIQYLLGDIFHSTPQVVGTPANVFYFANDLRSELSPDEPCLAGDENKNKGYRCFFERQRLRRKILVVGSNDGQLHAFDAGRFRNGSDTDFFTGESLVNDRTPQGSFDNGTGKELFSYVPRMVFPKVKEQALVAPNRHFFTVDGNITASDVFIDPLRDGDEAVPTDPTADDPFPSEADREWRTVLVGSLRRGGVGYFALDVTQPDPVVEETGIGFVPEVSGTNNPATGNYLPGCIANGTDCGPVDFPSVVWEFTDSFYKGGQWYRVDEDEEFANDSLTPLPALDPTDPSIGKHDLGDSWSTTNIGRIKICDGTSCGGATPAENADVEERFVAIFGGGMDYESKLSPLAETRGNWLYMVDVETGEAIYKQRLEGAAPAEPAAVDTDGDGLLDRIYIGTLAGFLYRVDIGPDASGKYPALKATTVCGIEPASGATECTLKDRLPRDVWAPRILFDTNFDGSTAITSRRSIYFRPSVIFRAGGGNYAVAFGTGDREDLWSLDGQDGRFYVFVDPFAPNAIPTTPLTEASLRRIEVGVDPVQQSGDFLEQFGGWYLVMPENQRVITETFALSGLTVFSAYEPLIYLGEDTTSGDDTSGGTVEDPTERVCGDKTESVGENQVCSLRGNSHIYVVNTTNGNGLLFDDAGVQGRTKIVSDFVTNPFTEPGQSKRGSDNTEDGATADDLTPDLKQIMESLKDLFPEQCQFANYRMDVKTIAADTSLQFIAPVPVCIIEHNWKEY